MFKKCQILQHPNNTITDSFSEYCQLYGHPHGRQSRPGWACLGNMRAVIHSEMRKSFWGKIWGTRFGIICCVCDTNHCINKLNSPFYMFFKHKLDSVDAYMTIKPHFNRSTTTKTVSRVPVSCEISMWKSHLRETRLHLFFFFFFFRGMIVSFKNTHTHYIIFHKIPLAL